MEKIWNDSQKHKQFMSSVGMAVSPLPHADRKDSLTSLGA